MELCSIEDAFPDFQRPASKKNVNAAALTKEQRRAIKKAKKARVVEPAEEVETDPDRPALKRMGELPAFVNYSDAFQDLSGTTASIPKVDAILKNVKYPDYFGKGPDDEVEGFSNFTGVDEDTIANRLVPQTLSRGFDRVGVDKAGSGGGELPAPSRNDNWKPLTDAKVTTANTTENMTKTAVPALRDEPHVEPPKREVLLAKIQDLTKRLEDLERHRPRNNQRELLIFISSGMFLIISFDLAMRAVYRSR
jgi:hypothetical protein